jgi:hypothetical protein
MRLANGSKFFDTPPLWLGLLLLLLVPASSRATTESTPDAANTFRWIHENSDPQLWQQIESAFHDELAPDQPTPDTSPVEVFQYKYFQKVGVVNHSALVIIGHRQTKELTKQNSWNQYWSAFNFDLASQQKTIIPDADGMYRWKFVGLAKFGPSPIPDITFAYDTCTECDGASLFVSLFYDPEKSIWSFRPWASIVDSLPADKGLIVNKPPEDEGELPLDCIYAIIDAEKNGLQSIAIRCKEVEIEPKGNASITDGTAIYSLSDGKFKHRGISDESEIAALSAKMCQMNSPFNSSSFLCKLPAYMPITAGQSSALDQMFPKAPKTARTVARFRKLTKNTTMSEIVSRCGRPDELAGSGTNIFIYYLDDGSLIAIGATGPTVPILYANRITYSGKPSSLLPEK